MKNYYENLAEIVRMLAVNGEDTTVYRRQLFYVRLESFLYKINTNESKIIFWTDIYHAYFHILINENPDRKDIYTIKRIKFANYLLSLNDIEYGILRNRKKFKFISCRVPFFREILIRLSLDNLGNATNIVLNKDFVNRETRNKMDDCTAIKSYTLA